MRYLFIIILAGVLSSFGKHGESRNTNVHNWVIYYNDSVLLDTRKDGHSTGSIEIPLMQVKNIDSLRIKYYNDFLLNITMIFYVETSLYYSSEINIKMFISAILTKSLFRYLIL